MIPGLDRLLARSCLHVAVDLQRLFAEPAARHAPGFADILPQGVRPGRHAPGRTVGSILPRFDERAVIVTTAEVPAAWRLQGGDS